MTTSNGILSGGFQSETALESYIDQYPDNFEEGLLVLDRQYYDGNGFVDLLCLDREGQLVVVEIKHPEAQVTTLTLVLRYLHSVNMRRPELLRKYQSQKKFKHMTDRPPRAIIIAPKMSIDLQYALAFIKENTIELQEAIAGFVNATKTTEAIGRPVNLNIIQPLSPSHQRSISEILMINRNTALQKTGSEILEFAKLLGEPGKVTAHPLSNRVVLRCPTDTGGKLRVRLRLIPQKTNVRLLLRTSTGEFIAKSISSAPGWDDAIKNEVASAFASTKSSGSMTTISPH